MNEEELAALVVDEEQQKQLDRQHADNSTTPTV